MSKATIALSATIDSCKSFTRRAFMRLGAITVAGAAVPAAMALTAPMPATPIQFAPTERGRALLAALAARREHINSEFARCGNVDAEDYQMHGVDEAAEAIRATPIRTVGNLVDHLIALGERCEPHCMSENTEFAPSIAAMLGAAGLSINDCTVVAYEPAELVYRNGGEA